MFSIHDWVVVAVLDSRVVGLNAGASFEDFGHEAVCILCLFVLCIDVVSL